MEAVRLHYRASLFSPSAILRSIMLEPATRATEPRRTQKAGAGLLIPVSYAVNATLLGEEQMRVEPLSVVAAIATAAALIGSVSAEEAGPLVIAKQGYFFVGGKYFDTPNGKVMAGHAYVEYLIPDKRTHRFPLVMIAGGAMSGANLTGTPDGRDGWAQYFLAHGYAVY